MTTIDMPDESVHLVHTSGIDSSLVKRLVQAIAKAEGYEGWLSVKLSKNNHWIDKNAQDSAESLISSITSDRLSWVAVTVFLATIHIIKKNTQSEDSYKTLVEFTLVLDTVLAKADVLLSSR